ncbi:hypothetical protein B0A55_00549 [Friedmanniomyces simplex]|uniref:BZIP domain-containing protein n=1 Tax=Friedmanniomyces simplex TaxID=329884 RepID=A0A4U0Y2X7_9PEZI|nr:hypothetical protein B0A55_00549 [Friedmanniomyces simplex]
MAYHGRRAPNVSAYLANLNAIPSAQDIAGQADFPLADDGLDFLTNAEFFDFDGGFDDVGAFPTETSIPEVPALQKAGAGVPAKATAPQYQFSEFQTYPPLPLPTNPSPNTSSRLPSPASATTLQGAYPPQQPLQLPLSASNPPPTGEKRSASAAGLAVPASDLEEGSRFAAEEDKRRRNTAASARFRVKKKQREMALERQTKEMGDRVSALEGRVRELEMENLWLRGLVVEKGKGKEGKGVLDRLAEGPGGQGEGAERSTGGRTGGVGTVVEAEEAEEEEEGEGEV